MPTNLKLLDSFKLTGHLSSNFACELSEDEHISIISDLGLYIIGQKPNLSSVFPSYSCQKFFLKPSSFAVCENVDIDINSFVHQLPKDVLYESALCVGLTQNLNVATPAIPSILTAQWSGANLLNENVGCLLGLLTNLGSLELYMKTVSESNVTEYKLVLNVTNEILKMRKEDFSYSTKLPAVQKIRELKKRVEYISPLTFIWGHTFSHNGENCACIFLGHYDGDISVWRIYSGNQGIQCDFLHRYTSANLGNISSIYWHQTSACTGALCVGDSAGKLAVLKVTDLDKAECSIGNETMFYSETDQKIEKISVMTLEQYSILIAVKQSHILLYALDSAGRVFDCKIHNVKNYYITGLSHKGNIIKVLTFTGQFKELVISVHLSKILLTENEIPVKSELSGYITHGFIASSNQILYAFVYGPCRLRNSIKGKQFINFAVFHDAHLNPLKLLTTNTTGSLRNFWDCFEALRIICVKEQRFPWLGLDYNLDLDNQSLVELKTLRLIAKISETVFSVIKRVVSYDIKPFILLHYLVDIKLVMHRLAQLLKDRAEGKELTLFQLRSIDLQVCFLKEMVVSGVLLKAQVGQTFIQEISHILAIANEIVFPDMEQCMFCGEKLIGPMCLPPHADSRCVFTMMPIFFSPAFQCMLCHALVHSEMDLHQPITCPYCDYPMEKITINPSIKNRINDCETVFKDNQIFSRCASDCIRDDHKVISELYVNLEDKDISVASVSDAEDGCGESDLRTVYFKLAHLSVAEAASEGALHVNDDKEK